MENKNQIELNIAGELCSKSNSRQLVLRGKYPRVIKSAKALSYVKSSLLQLKTQLRARETLQKSIVMEAHVYYASRRPDLDVSLLMDVLQEAGVYKNDRCVVEIHAFKYRDVKNPRTIVRIRELTDEEMSSTGLL